MQFPLLDFVVPDVYSVQAASSKGERALSSAGNTYYMVTEYTGCWTSRELYHCSAQCQSFQGDSKFKVMHSEKTCNMFLFAVFLYKSCCLKSFLNWNFCWYWFGIGIAEFWKINQYQYNPSFWYGISIQYNTYCSSVRSPMESNVRNIYTWMYGCTVNMCFLTTCPDILCSTETQLILRLQKNWSGNFRIKSQNEMQAKVF